MLIVYDKVTLGLKLGSLLKTVCWIVYVCIDVAYGSHKGNDVTFGIISIVISHLLAFSSIITFGTTVNTLCIVKKLDLSSVC